MKTIFVKFLPCTNNRPSRLKAFDMDNNSVTISYPHDVSSRERPLAAAIALCKKMDWKGKLVFGTHKKVDCFTFVADNYNIYDIETGELAS